MFCMAFNTLTVYRLHPLQAILEMKEQGETVDFLMSYNTSCVTFRFQKCFLHGKLGLGHWFICQ